MAARRLGRLEGLAYQSPPPSYCRRAIVRIGGSGRAPAKGSSARAQIAPARRLEVIILIIRRPLQVSRLPPARGDRPNAWTLLTPGSPWRRRHDWSSRRPAASERARARGLRPAQAGLPHPPPARARHVAPLVHSTRGARRPFLDEPLRTA